MRGSGEGGVGCVLSGMFVCVLWCGDDDVCVDDWCE